MFSLFRRTRRNNSQANKINEIRTMIQTPESEFLFPHKKNNIDYIKSEPSKYTLKLTHTWNVYLNDFIKDVLVPLSKLEPPVKFKTFESFKEWVLTEGTLESLDSSLVNKLYNYLERVQITKYSNDEMKNLRALLNYEKDPWYRGEPVENDTGVQLNNIPVETRIQRILNRQLPLEKEIILWRGQSQTYMISPSWFSTSLDRDIAKEYGINLFKIHIQPGVKVLDLYKEYNKYGIDNPVNNVYKMRAYMRRHDFMYPIAKVTRNYKRYKEYIVEGGGTFYKDINKTEEGVKEVYSTSCKSNTTYPIYYETYYFPPTEPLAEKQWSKNLYKTVNNTKKSVNKSRTRKNERNLLLSLKTLRRTPNIIETINYPTNLFNKTKK